MEYIAQAIGFIGMAFVFIAFQNNDKRKILIFQGIAGIVFTVHFVMLGAFTGAGMNAVEVIRNIAFLICVNDRWKKVWTALFIVVFIFMGIFTWENMWSLLPIAAMSLSNIAFYFKSPRYIRYCFAPVFLGWLIYNAHSGSIAGVLTEVFDLSSLLIAAIRFDILKHSSEKTELKPQVPSNKHK